MQPIAKNLSRLLPLSAALGFLAALLRYKCGITVVISGSSETAVNFAAVASREVFWEMESKEKQEQRSWSDRRWGRFLGRQIQKVGK